MRQLALHEMGEVIRKVRKERGLRLEDLADENISPATVSNIERGVTHVSPEKITYLLEKLNLPIHKLPEMLYREQEELKKMRLELLAVSTLLKTGHVEEALRRLEEFSLDDHHPLAAQVLYVKAECLMEKRKWKQAERTLFNVLRIVQQGHGKESNMEAAAYLLLGVVRSRQNDLEQALEYTNSGIKSYSPQGDNKHIKSLLHRNKGVYLLRLGRVAEGLRLVQEIMDRPGEPDDLETLLCFHWLKAEFSRLSGLLDEAAETAMKGIDIAGRNRAHGSLCDLWTVLGSVYALKKEYDLAETSFRMALRMEGLFPDDRRLVTAYTRLGQLYMTTDKTDEACKTVKTAVKYAERFQEPAPLCHSLTLLGDLYLQTGRPDEAQSTYRKALDVAVKHRFTDRQFRLWLRLARCYDGRDEQKFQECMRNMYNSKKDFQSCEERIFDECW
ncbi:helix-turn-helix domain-containing protein [Staphylospora marina]|uniref:helix-turn-helix domain-containing protein n=1 Tax=Staphylospora marina TaxID=2490858 RepID=UPI000F5BB4B0|nr:helix-turn-helix domain-containing protein [Staphylospora marina]